MQQLTKYNPPEPGALMEQTDPGDLLRFAVEKGASVETIERLMAVRRELKKEAAKEAFHSDMGLFQSECPVVLKSVFGAQNKYKYAPLDHIVSQVKGLLEKHGFSHRQTSPETKSGFVRVVVIVTHRRGHSEESAFEVPVDTKTTSTGALIMSAPQSYAAALTVATRRAFCLAFGILTADEDKDGQTAQVKVGLKSMAKQNFGGGQSEESSGTHNPVADPAAELKSAKAALWDALKSVRGPEKSWTVAEEWLVDENFIDPNNCRIADQSTSTLRAITAQVKLKLKI